MSNCRQLNAKGKFCGKKATQNSAFCKKHKEEYESKQQKFKEQMEVEPELKQYVPKAFYSSTFPTDDPKRRVVYKKKDVMHSRTDTENMTDLRATARARKIN